MLEIYGNWEEFEIILVQSGVMLTKEPSETSTQHCRLVAMELQ